MAIQNLGSEAFCFIATRMDLTSIWRNTQNAVEIMVQSAAYSRGWKTQRTQAGPGELTKQISSIGRGRQVRATDANDGGE